MPFTLFRFFHSLFVFLLNYVLERVTITKHYWIFLTGSVMAGVVILNAQGSQRKFHFEENAGSNRTLAEYLRIYRFDYIEPL